MTSIWKFYNWMKTLADRFLLPLQRRHAMDLARGKGEECFIPNREMTQLANALIMWLHSLDGLLLEAGPFRAQMDGTFKTQEYAWTRNADMLFSTYSNSGSQNTWFLILTNSRIPS